jgi:glutathione S-transferase
MIKLVVITAAVLLLGMNKVRGLAWGGIKNLFKQSSSNSMSTLVSRDIPSWDALQEQVLATPTGELMKSEENLRERGDGPPHTDAKIRLFGSTGEPRVTYYRDTAAWCPYCQKVWILLEEKKIPYRVEKINMRSYGDKPSEFLRKVPNGLLPAIELDGELQTDSLGIMLNLERTFTGANHKATLPTESSPKAEVDRTNKLFRLERELFGSWCGLVFRPSMTNAPRNNFERDLDAVNAELEVTEGPWFLDYFSIVDLTYLTHIERMCASVAYWSGFKVRGDGRWPAIERWLDAFEQMPSYMATKSDYYTHVMDIPPQYGPGYRVKGSTAQALADSIDGRDGSWNLPLPAFSPTDVEPVSAAINPGEESARHEAAYKLIRNNAAIAKFSLRGAGTPGAKRFQAPLADPYATPNMDYVEPMDACLRLVTNMLLSGEATELPLVSPGATEGYTVDNECSEALKTSIAYLRDRVGVPRDMGYPAARQLRAHLNHVINQLS